LPGLLGDVGVNIDDPTSELGLDACDPANQRHPPARIGRSFCSERKLVNRDCGEPKILLLLNELKHSPLRFGSHQFGHNVCVQENRPHFS
jgi:hypothetical protein